MTQATESSTAHPQLPVDIQQALEALRQLQALDLQRHRDMVEILTQMIQTATQLTGAPPSTQAPAEGEPGVSAALQASSGADRPLDHLLAASSQAAAGSDTASSPQDVQGSLAQAFTDVIKAQAQGRILMQAAMTMWVSACLSRDFSAGMARPA